MCKQCIFYQFPAAFRIPLVLEVGQHCIFFQFRAGSFLMSELKIISTTMIRNTGTELHIFPHPKFRFLMCVDMVYVLCSVLQQFLLPISLELSAFLLNIGSCAMDQWKIRGLQILYLCQLNYAMHVNWMQVSHQFNFFSFNHCRKHCIFFHFHSNLIEEKKKAICSKIPYK